MAIWLGSTVVSVFTLAGMLSILDSNKEASLVKNSDNYKTAQVRKENALDTASRWAFASKYNLDTLNSNLVELSAIRERREISYQAYLTEKLIIKDKIKARKNYESALNTQELAGGLMVQNATDTRISTNPFLSHVSDTTGFKASLLKMVFYLAVTMLLEWAAWFLGGEVTKIEELLRTTKRQRLEMKNKKEFGATFEEVASVKPEKKETTALPSNLENAYFLLVNGRKKGGEKRAISAQNFINSLASHLEQNNLIKKYAGVEFKAVNKSDNLDYAVYKVNRPTLKNQPKNTPNIELKKSVPQKGKEQKKPVLIPKKERGTDEEQKMIKPDRVSTGSKRNNRNEKKRRNARHRNGGAKCPSIYCH